MSDLNPYEEGLALELQAAQKRIEALTEQLAAARKDAEEAEVYAEELEAKVARLVEAIDYILDGMAIDAPDYEIDPDNDFLDAVNSDWVRDVLTRLAAAMKGADR